MKLHLAVAGLVAGLGLAGSAVAAPSFTWNLGPSTDLAGPVSGSYSFNSSGEVVNAYGYATQNSNGSGKFTKQNITLWDGGLGIKTSGYSNENGQPNHATDNEDRDELFVFEFDSADYIATGFQIGWRADAKPDIRVWIGGDSAIDFTNVCFTGCASTLASLGFEDYLFENVNTNTTQALNGGAGKYLIITADYSVADGESCSSSKVKQNKKWVWVETCTPKYKYDYFKLSQITGTEQPPEEKVPEPASLSLIALGLLGLIAAHRRKAAV